MSDNEINAMFCEVLQNMGIDAGLKGVILPLSGKAETYIGIDTPYTDIMTVSARNGIMTVQHERFREDWSIDLADPESLDKLMATIKFRLDLPEATPVAHPQEPCQ